MNRGQGASRPSRMDPKTREALANRKKQSKEEEKARILGGISPEHHDVTWATYLAWARKAKYRRTREINRKLKEHLGPELMRLVKINTKIPITEKFDFNAATTTTEDPPKSRSKRKRDDGEEVPKPKRTRKPKSAPPPPEDDSLISD
jgi:hypothetical protein